MFCCRTCKISNMCYYLFQNLAKTKPVSITKLYVMFARTVLFINSPKTKKGKMVETNKLSMGQTIAKLFMGAFLYEVDEKNGAKNIQTIVSNFRKWIGDDEAKKLIDSSEASLIALVNSCIEVAVIGRVSKETEEQMKALEPPVRVTTEFLFLRLTGKDVMQEKEDREHWAPALWRLKKMAKKYILLSPSKVNEEELVAVLKEIFVPFTSELRLHALRLV